MNKKLITIIAIVVVVVILVIVGGFLILNKKGILNKNEESTQSGPLVPMETSEDLENLIDKIYEKTQIELFGLETHEVNLTDEWELSAYTGLSSSENLDKVIASECMVTSQAYSLTLVKVSDGADVEEVKQKMVDNINMRRWVCVSAEVVYATNSGNVIILVMSSKDIAKPQYDAFKEIVGGTFGKELTREEEQEELDDEMFLVEDQPIVQ